jgi:shikimate dehydrogenase
MEVFLKLKLGLIGNAIAKSRAPALHIFLGKLHGIEVTYELFDPKTTASRGFIDQLSHLSDNGYNGCNVTYPFKQIAMQSVQKCQASSQLVGATNTIKFSTKTCAINTDYSGFIRAITAKQAVAELGSALILGAGGVGRAVAFGLASLSTETCHIFDTSADKASELVDALRKHSFDAEVVQQSDLEIVSQKVEGILNCSPIGHYQSPGTPISSEYIGSQKWAFDAVYTPLETEFLRTCREANLRVVSGFELFFYQGLDAFEFWTDQKTNENDVKEAFIHESGIDSALI